MQCCGDPIHVGQIVITSSRLKIQQNAFLKDMTRIPMTGLCLVYMVAPNTKLGL